MENYRTRNLIFPMTLNSRLFSKCSHRKSENMKFKPENKTASMTFKRSSQLIKNQKLFTTQSSSQSHWSSLTTKISASSSKVSSQSESSTEKWLCSLKIKTSSETLNSTWSFSNLKKCFSSKSLSRSTISSLHKKSKMKIWNSEKFRKF